jgi:DNA-directed RNA polymerase specialized sigma subunit
MCKIYENISEREKTDLVRQYEPLINKLTKQFVSQVKIDWESVKSMAYEGFVLAMLNYDDERSKLTFKQFAGWSIRNNILSSLDKELRTVSMSAYAQKKAQEVGEATFNSVSLSVISGDSSATGDDDNRACKEFKYGVYEKDKFSDGDVYEYLYSRLEDAFSARDCEMFYRVFGLKGHPDEKGKDVAQYFGVSEGLVSQKIKKMVLYIRKDNELNEMLANLIA